MITITDFIKPRFNFSAGGGSNGEGYSLADDAIKCGYGEPTEVNHPDRPDNHNRISNVSTSTNGITGIQQIKLSYSNYNANLNYSNDFCALNGEQCATEANANNIALNVEDTISADYDTNDAVFTMTNSMKIGQNAFVFQLWINP